MISRIQHAVPALNLQEGVELASGAAITVASASLWAAGDVGELLPIAVAVGYLVIVHNIWRKAKRRQANVVATGTLPSRKLGEGRLPKLMAAYWLFFVLVMGATFSWVAVSQLRKNGGSPYSDVLLVAGVLVIGFALIGLRSLWRRPPPSTK